MRAAAEKYITGKKATSVKNHSWWKFIFYGNYFYGICAVALSVEATLQQRFPLNRVSYYFIVFIATVIYYVYPYLKKDQAGKTDGRSTWYRKNYSVMFWNQVIMAIILVAFITWFEVISFREFSLPSGHFITMLSTLVV